MVPSLCRKRHIARDLRSFAAFSVYLSRGALHKPSSFSERSVVLLCILEEMCLGQVGRVRPKTVESVVKRDITIVFCVVSRT